MKTVHLEIAVDDEREGVCGFCPMILTYLSGAATCSWGRTEHSLGGNDKDGFLRHAECLAATRLADAQSGAIQAAVAWANGRIDDDKTTVALINAVRAVVAEQRKAGPGDG